MRLVAAIEDPAVAEQIRRHLHLPTRAPPRGRPGRPPRKLVLDRQHDFDSVDPPALFE